MSCAYASSVLRIRRARAAHEPCPTPPSTSRSPAAPDPVRTEGTPPQPPTEQQTPTAGLRLPGSPQGNRRTSAGSAVQGQGGRQRRSGVARPPSAYAGQQGPRPSLPPAPACVHKAERVHTYAAAGGMHKKKRMSVNCHRRTPVVFGQAACVPDRARAAACAACRDSANSSPRLLSACPCRRRQVLQRSRKRRA